MYNYNIYIYYIQYIHVNVRKEQRCILNSPAGSCQQISKKPIYLGQNSRTTSCWQLLKEHTGTITCLQGEWPSFN